MKSSSGTYHIQKGQKIVGSCHLAQRDKGVFSVEGCKEVDEFDPTRFNKKVSEVPFFLFWRGVANSLKRPRVFIFSDVWGRLFRVHSSSVALVMQTNEGISFSRNCGAAPAGE